MISHHHGEVLPPGLREHDVDPGAVRDPGGAAIGGDLEAITPPPDGDP